MYAGVTSVYTTITLAGILTQVYWRTYHPKSFKKYNYILGGALDGGAQGELERSSASSALTVSIVMIFILSFAVFGAAGTERPFPFVSDISLDRQC